MTETDGARTVSEVAEAVANWSRLTAGDGDVSEKKATPGVLVWLGPAPTETDTDGAEAEKVDAPAGYDRFDCAGNGDAEIATGDGSNDRDRTGSGAEIENVADEGNLSASPVTVVTLGDVNVTAQAPGVKVLI